MNIVAVDYKGKGFMLMDKDRVDEDDYVIPFIDVSYILTHEQALKDHVAECTYYGIPPYIGSDTELEERIEKITLN